MRTYPFGYSSKRLSLQELETKSTWTMVHPEMRRRLVAMFDDAQNNGKDLGIGTGGRTSAQQERMFRERYVEDPNGKTRWDGKRWSKKPGVAAAAPPGRSYHEETDPQGFCFAADLVGDLNWMNANCHRFGLKHFANVNSEPWHVQPVELPNSRSGYKASVRLKEGFVSPAPAVGVSLPSMVESPLKFTYPGTPIRFGSTGAAVQLVQVVVGAHPDGKFLKQTEAAVKVWQKANGLLDDGVVGAVTWKKMFG
jgi:peptidoglycan hydrolase-like protein with peptidoglycan-binding domain